MRIRMILRKNIYLLEKYEMITRLQFLVGNLSVSLEKRKNTVFAVIISIFFIELIRTAWISDDAAITLRTVLNLINGYGLRFNIDERVQAFTHPLWLFAIAGLSIATQNIFYATFTLSISTSVVAVWLLFTRVSKSYGSAVVAGLALLLSKAFVDFSTSGLENPLSHLLILFSVLAAISAVGSADRKSLALFFASFSLAYLNRPDLLVLLFPLASLVAVKNLSNPGNLFVSMAVGAVPALTWTIFSTYYFGFPFPNTAYAKLATGIALDERFIQGLRYLLHSVNTDPLTPAFILLGVFIGAYSSFVSKALSLGILLYLTYVVSIGGDFMEGRFLTVPLFVAAIVMARSDLTRVQLYSIGVVILALGMIVMNSTLLSNSLYSNTKISSNGIADERGFYYQQFGLLTAKENTFAAPTWKINGKKVDITCAGLGFSGMIDGPGMHYIDPCGLADPLLARLPARSDPNWRIGHFVRQLPTDYQESLETNQNIIKDARTRAYYESIRTITRSPLSDSQRLLEILRFNLGRVEKPDFAMYQFESVPRSSKLCDGDGCRHSRRAAQSKVQFSP